MFFAVSDTSKSCDLQQILWEISWWTWIMMFCTFLTNSCILMLLIEEEFILEEFNMLNDVTMCWILFTDATVWVLTCLLLL